MFSMKNTQDDLDVWFATLKSKKELITDIGTFISQETAKLQELLINHFAKQTPSESASSRNTKDSATHKEVMWRNIKKEPSHRPRILLRRSDGQTQVCPPKECQAQVCPP